jgi:hypothetical protein
VIYCPSQFADKLVICRLATGSIEGELVGLERPAVLSTSGALIAAGGRNGQVAVWNYSSRELLKVFKAHSSVVFGVALSPDWRVLATGGSDSVIHLWDTQSFQLERHLRGHRGQVWNLRFPDDGSYLASASMDQSVKLWQGAALQGLDPGSMAATTAPRPTDTEQIGEANAGVAISQEPPATHVVRPGEDIQAAITGARSGDRIELLAGVHAVTRPIIVTKPLNLAGARGGNGRETVLQCREGVPTVIRIETGSSQLTRLQDLTIETLANGVQHLSGNLVLQRCDLTLRSSLDLYAALTLDAMTGNDSVTVDECSLVVEYVGDTIEGTPPDIDVIIANPGTHYASLVVTRCKIDNRIPNAVAHGIESRTMRSHVTIEENEVRSLGVGILLPNHQGRIEIRENTVWASRGGIIVGSDEPEPSYIVGNRINIEHQELEIFPVFVRSYSVRSGTSCIRIGHTSAGITAGFFLQEVIGLAAHFRIEDNVLTGNPDYGISLLDSPSPEAFGPSTPNRSHDNIVTRNDFTQLRASLYDLALGAATYNNRIHDNVGLKKVFKEAGDQDRNHVSLPAPSVRR